MSHPRPVLERQGNRWVARSPWPAIEAAGATREDALIAWGLALAQREMFRADDLQGELEQLRASSSSRIRTHDRR